MLLNQYEVDQIVRAIDLRRRSRRLQNKPQPTGNRCRFERRLTHPGTLLIKGCRP